MNVYSKAFPLETGRKAIGKALLTLMILFAGEVKRHSICKRSRFLDTGCKETGPTPFLYVILMG